MVYLGLPIENCNFPWQTVSDYRINQRVILIPWISVPPEPWRQTRWANHMKKRTGWAVVIEFKPCWLMIIVENHWYVYIYTYYHVIIVIPKYIYIYIYIRSYQLVIITTILCCFIVMIVIHIDLFVLWLLQWFPYTYIYISTYYLN